MELEKLLGSDAYIIKEDRIHKTRILGVMKEISLSSEGKPLPPKYFFRLHINKKEWVSEEYIYLNKEDIIKGL